MAAPTILSPAPITSNISTKELKLETDWLKWLTGSNGLIYYVQKLINSYDSTKSGMIALVSGTIVISNTKVTATSAIRLTPQSTTGGSPGDLSVVLNPGIGFTINSTSATDTRTIFYEIVEAL